MAVRVDTIPDELKARKQWVCWRLEHGRKVPYNTRTGRRAQSDNPATWSTFEQACAAYGNCTHGYAGVGYVFAEDDPFAGVDLDDCIDADGELAAWA